jgi:serine/threonine protein kinase
MSPEQAGGGRASAATDVWGIGATLYEAATGQRPFPDARHGIYPQLDRQAPSVAESRRAPAAFVSIVDACLSPAPADRPTVAQLADELDAAIGD